MLAVAATIPDAATRDQFADRLAHKARITESVIRDEIRKAAAQKKTAAPAVAVSPSGGRIRLAEQGLLWTLMHRPVEGLAAVAQLEEADLEGLLAAPVLRLAASLADMPPDVLPQLLRERLRRGGAVAVRAGWRRRGAGGGRRTLRQYAFDATASSGSGRACRTRSTGCSRAPGMDEAALVVLWERKKELLRQLEDLI